MTYIIICDSYLPSNSAAAVLISDLSRSFVAAGESVVLVVPSFDGVDRTIKTGEFLEIYYAAVCKSKDVIFIKRIFAELLNPWIIWWKLKNNRAFSDKKVCGIIWYSPSIFWGPLVKRLKRHFNCRSYLILRDIFPDWALDLGVLRRGPTYLFLKLIELYQYRQADRIGVQSPNSFEVFIKKNPSYRPMTEVLWNWTVIPSQGCDLSDCPIDISKTHLSGKTIFVFAGNLGVAQGVENLIRVMNDLSSCDELGFLVVGRGSEFSVLKDAIVKHALKNTLLFDEINSRHIPTLYRQCHAGMIFLDTRHKTPNIPGKFGPYIASGLPIFALVNSGNDLVKIITENKIGVVMTDDSISSLSLGVLDLMGKIRTDPLISSRCRGVATTLFSVDRARDQILNFYSS